MAEEGNTSWDALRRELALDEGRVVFYERVIELRQELGRRLEQRGVDEETITRVIDADNVRLKQLVQEGSDVDLGALTDELVERAGGLAPE